MHATNPMRVFVAGATGVVGRRVVARLATAGHRVTGVARSPEGAARVLEAGGEPVEVDLFDPAATAAAVEGHDAVINLATHIPPLRRATRAGAWAENHRIRRKVSTNLVDAALAAGARRFVQESITFPYPDGSDRWLDESVPFAPGPHTESVAAVEAAAARFDAVGPDRTGVVLRFGLFYGPDSGHSVDLLRLARRGVGAVAGAADGYLSQLTTDDAASAVLAALGAPGGTYNVVDDEPLTKAEQLAVLAGVVGRRRLRPLPAWLTRRGGPYVEVMARSQRVSNAAFKAATGWSPSTPNARQGWPAAVGQMDRPPQRRPRPGRPRRRRPQAVGAAVAGDDRNRRRATRAVLGLLAFFGAVVGLWALLAPRSFYDDFPGAGRHWVAVDGPYNEHLVRDVGGLNLGLAAVALLALVGLGPSLVRAAGLGWLLFSLPHLIYHLGHLGPLPTGDKVANVVALSATVALALAALALASPRAPFRPLRVRTGGRRPRSSS